MHERVGTCEVCGREVFCLNGFLNGVAENGRLRCFDCADREDVAADARKEEEKRTE
ncbi:hypothetical protein ACFFIY_12365 [Bhargavaea ullalensis]|uniref:SR1 protein n=1 Tax=Bhargavaea ullalensis TaxID=1265685 RepID=A0ABV2G7K8_9BACL